MTGRRRGAVPAGELEFTVEPVQVADRAQLGRCCDRTDAGVAARS